MVESDRHMSYEVIRHSLGIPATGVDSNLNDHLRVSTVWTL